MAQMRRILCGYGATFSCIAMCMGFLKIPNLIPIRFTFQGIFSAPFLQVKKSIENGAMSRRFIVANVSCNMNDACTIIPRTLTRYFTSVTFIPARLLWHNQVKRYRNRGDILQTFRPKPCNHLYLVIRYPRLSIRQIFIRVLQRVV